MANSNKFKNDKYYTPQEIVDTCFDILLKVVDDKDISRVIEPSAGNGSFIHKIKESFPNADKIYLDLYPESDDIIRQDFLEYNLEYSKNTLVIGNPPFGSMGNGFVQFFNKAIEFADYVAFILPISQFENSKRLYKFDLISSTNLGKIDFYYRNEHKSVECCFNIYKRPDSGLRTTKKRS